MTVADNKSINVNFNLPISVDQVWFFGSLIAFGALLVAVLYVRNKWAAKESGEWRLHEKQLVNAVYWAGWILSPLWLLLIALTIYGLLSLWFSLPNGKADDGEVTVRLHYLALAGLTTVLAGLIGAPLAILRVHTVERQTKAQEEGLITDRINKAVEGLGAEKVIKRTQIQDRPAPIPNTQNMTLNPPWATSSEKLEYGVEALAHEQTVPNIEVRIGAIYALERIAKHNLDEHIQIMEILCAYVRENAPIKKQTRSSKPRSDVQTALTVIGRRSEKQRKIEYSADLMWPKVQDSDVTRDLGADINKVIKFGTSLLQRFKLGVLWSAPPNQFFIDLSFCDLAGVNLRRGEFANANFSDCNLSGAKFLSANLQNCDFSGANLKAAELSLSNLSGSNFWMADLCSAGIVYSQVHGVEFWNTKFDETSDFTASTFYLASFREVDLSPVDISNGQIETAFGDNLTKLNKATIQPSHWGCEKRDRLEFIKEMKVWAINPLNYHSSA